MENVFWRFVIFALIGILGMVWDFGLTWLLKDKLNWNKYVANCIGFTMGVLNNYILNMKYNYHKASIWNSQAFSMFFIINVIGLVINLIVIFCSDRYFKIPFYVSKVIASGFGTIWNFLANHFLVFS